MVTVLFSYDAFPWCASNGVAPARNVKSSTLAGNRLVIDHSPREFDLEIKLQAYLGKTRRHDLQRALPGAAERVVLREDRADVQRIVQVEADRLAHPRQVQQ